MLEKNRRKSLKVTTLYVTGFHDLTNFLNLLKELIYLTLFGTSSQIFGPRYLTDCKP